MPENQRNPCRVRPKRFTDKRVCVCKFILMLKSNSGNSKMVSTEYKVSMILGDRYKNAY